MNRAAKSYLTSGVALAGASVIAISPMVAAPLSPPGTDTHTAFSVSTANVQLATTVNPLAAWAEVVSSAYGNVASLGEEVLSDPAPILRQFILNQLSNGEAVVSAATGAVGGFLEYLSPDNAFGLGAQLQTAAEQLSSGNIAGAIETATQALFLAPVISVAFPVLSSGLLDIPGTMAQNFANVVKTVTDPNTVLPIALGALGTVLAPVNAFGDSLQETFDALGDGDVGAALNAVINIPAAVVGAVLNGYTNLAGSVFPGLFSEDGLVHALVVTLPRAIAAAITPEEEGSAAAANGPADVPTAVLASVQTDDEQAADSGAASEDADGDGGAVDAVNASVTEETAEVAAGAEGEASDAQGEVVDESSAIGTEEVSEESGEGTAEPTEGSAESTGADEDLADETESSDDAAALEEGLDADAAASEDGSDEGDVTGDEGGSDAGDDESGSEDGESGDADADSTGSDSGGSDTGSGSESDGGSGDSD
ncbi:MULTISPECIES: hypothetical protein [Mycobacteriaceae]|uniref:Uncharacterized protein n=1 Tax=Mycolicibacterium parafortuitum TaxID=39692 RepID=A0ACC6MIY6_MYCPF|nr:MULTISPECIES: hypothetical protein [Mycobacteriaceae]MDZ5086957.1 hypothetical protein [Mycolicibacterium parafortuitum]GFM18282.1 uncharacterized protein PO1_contig-025-5 [Mycobacterium sp. PO1]GFM24568.1 uncharacterized protein PO2_contig-042-6 [Mycobacterium sp. PO2]